MTELELTIDLHKNTERQGPGSEADTLKALSFVDLLKDNELEIADLGCGSGGQTITLAKNLDAEITAVDLFPAFLNELNAKSRKLGLSQKIETLEKSIGELNFEKEKFDIIWSEGAIYNIGFENGIKNWKDFLKTGGYLAVSEITWITNSRPKEINDFWTNEYPEIDTASNKIKILEDNGFSLAGYFFLSEKSWLNYYNLLEENFEQFLIRNNNSKLAQKVVEEYKTEIKIYSKYKKYFSYGFYIAKKIW